MLSLDSLKTRTIYSKHQIDSLHIQFKNRLNEAYAQQSPQTIQNAMIIIKLLYYLSDVPSFPKQFNEIGEIQLLALLQILFMKSSHWKAHKQTVQKQVSIVMKKIVKFVPTYQIKPQIAAVQSQQGQQKDAINFFAHYLEKISKTKSQQSMMVAISFLRVYLIDQLQNKKKALALTQNNVILLDWKNINEGLIKICNQLQNIKNQQICVSICYWLCSEHKSFIQQCVIKGVITFLCQTLVNKNISEWYGRKILSFLKLLLLGIENKNEIASGDIQSCIGLFTLKFDNQTILQQAKSLFSHMKNGQGKVQKQIQAYNKYVSQKNPKNLQQAIKNSRVLLLYSEDEKVKNQLNDRTNLQYFSKVIKKQQNLSLLCQIFNIIAYSSINKSVHGQEEDHAISVIKKVSSILQSSKDKQQLTSSNKKVLITLIRMLKQLVQGKQYSQKLMQKIKSQAILKKLGKFSDCTNFQYQRQLLSLSRIIDMAGKQPGSPMKSSNPGQSSDIMKALVKHMNQKVRRVGKKLQDDLEQIQLLYQMIQRGEPPSHKQQTIAAIFQKIKVKKNQTEQVQITILDRSQQQRNRQLVNKINFFAIASLQKLQNEHYNDTNYPLKNEDINKLFNIGFTCEDVDILKADAGYLIALDHNNKLNDDFKSKLNQLYRKYKQKVGEDLELIYAGNKTKKPIEQQKKQRTIQEIIQDSLNKNLQPEEYQILQNALLNEQDPTILKKWLQKYSTAKQISSQSTKTLVLKYLFKLSQMKDLKSQVFNKYSQFLSQNVLNCSQSDRNLIYKIYSQLFDQNINSNKQYFSKELQKSYEHLSKQSIQFSDNCLGLLQYKGTNNRLEQYWKYIYNLPQIIGREAVYLIKQADQQKIDKFWSFFAKPIQENIKDQKKLTLHFLERAGKYTNKDSWTKFGLIKFIQQLVKCLNKRAQQIRNKPATQGGLRRLVRISKAIKSITMNQDLDITTQIKTMHDSVTYNIKKHPKIQSTNIKMNQLNIEYIKNLLQILKYIYKRREGFEKVKKQLKVFDDVSQSITQYKNSNFNDTLLEIFRILLLRDDKHEQFITTSKMYEDHKNKLKSCSTNKGLQNAQSCQRIIENISKSNQTKFKKQFLQYFFPDEAAKMQAKQAIVFSPQDLLKHLKNLLNPPYQFGLNYLQKKLILVQNSDFANTLVKIFVNSERLYQQDKQYEQKTLVQVQQKIADSIWGLGIQLNPDFYKMINMNLIGLKVCLRTKGLGVEGVAIVCQKFFQYPQQIPLCSQILFINTVSNKQWTIVLDKKIPQLVNTIYKNKGKDPIYGKSLANLIGSSSKLKTIQTQYKVQLQLFQNLGTYSTNIPCLASTVYALSGLVYLNDTNQKISGTKQCINYYLKILQQNSGSSLIFDKVCNLLSNLIYKNTALIITYIQLNAQVIVIKIASGLLYQYVPYKQFLRLIGNLSLSLQQANSITKTQFLNLWSHILQQAQNNKHQDVIKYSFDIIFNLLNYHQIQAKQIAYKIYQANCCIKIINYLQRNCLSSNVVQSGIDALQKQFILQAIRKQALENGLLKCMQDIANTQSWNENILQKYIKVLFSLIKQNSSINTYILKSQICAKLANFIKQHPQINPQYLDLLVTLSDVIYQKGEHKLFVQAGFIDLLSEILKIKQLKSINAAAIIDQFMVLHNQKVLNGLAYTKMFGGLMARLQIQFRDENSKKIISAITKIRDRISINTRAATILLQFGYMFLTQKQIITSQKYQKRVREFICLLSYFISFSVELKIIFREEGFIEILQSWIKIDKTLDQDNSVSQACRVCIFTIQNQQKFLVNIPSHVTQIQPYFNRVAQPLKCLLYRRDHTNKNAIIQIRKQKQKYQAVSFKAPDGQIKPKYIVPLDQIIGIRVYENANDIIFTESVFGTTGGIFQKSAVPLNCMTIIGIAGQQLSIRQLDVQFASQSIRDQFTQNFKYLVSMEYRNHRSYG